MRDTLVIALEASWEQDPVLLDKILWKTIEKNNRLCYTFSDKKPIVENVSNEKQRMPYLSGFTELLF